MKYKTETVRCHSCHGKGYILHNDHRCGKCSGSGYVEKKTEIKMAINGKMVFAIVVVLAIAWWLSF